MEKIVRQVNLYNGIGTSDKVYNMTLLEVEPNMFQVEVEYGPRRKTRKIYRKPSFPTTLPWAEEFYTDQLRQKKRRGYQEVD